MEKNCGKHANKQRDNRIASCSEYVICNIRTHVLDGRGHALNAHEKHKERTKDTYRFKQENKRVFFHL